MLHYISLVFRKLFRSVPGGRRCSKASRSVSEVLQSCLRRVKRVSPSAFKSESQCFNSAPKSPKMFQKRFKNVAQAFQKRFKSVSKTFQSLQKRFKSVSNRFESVSEVSPRGDGGGGPAIFCLYFAPPPSLKHDVFKAPLQRNACLPLWSTGATARQIHPG